MKKFFFVVLILISSIASYSQFIHKIKADSVLITNDSCNAELNLENSTKNVNGFLYNKGNGRTEFRKGLIKLNDSLYIIGNDTLNIAKGIGGNFIRNQNAVAQTSDFWISGMGRTGGNLTVGGNLLIGTTTDNNYKLQVNGASYFTNSLNTQVATTTTHEFRGAANQVFDFSSGAEDFTLRTGLVGGVAKVQSGPGNLELGSTGGDILFTPNSVETARIKANGNVLIGTSTDVPSAKLIIESTTQGFLKPRMTTTQRDAIASPVDGLAIHNNTTNREQLYINGAWKSILVEGDVGYIAGRVIVVDKDAVNATDTRTGLSKYNQFYPFKTITSAVASIVDGDILVVNPGMYTENLNITNSAFTNVVYFNSVSFTGNIQMGGKIFLTNTTINGVITMYYRGTDGPSGNIISGLDKGSSVINGKIAVTASPGANWLTVRHLGRITTPATGSASGSCFESFRNVLVDGVSTIENLSTTNVFVNGITGVGNLILTNIGTLTSEYTGSNVMFYAGLVSLKNVDKVVYKGSGYIAGDYNSSLKFAENAVFTSSTATYLFGTYGGSAANFPIKNCRFINSKATGYIFKAASVPTGGANKTKSYYIYDSQFQCTNNSGANYLFQINNDDIVNIHLINCISNQNTATYWVQNGSYTVTAPTIEIIANYVYNSAFLIQQPPTFN